MQWCVAVVFAVLQLCSPTLQADEKIQLYQLKEGEEKPSKSCDYATDSFNWTQIERGLVYPLFSFT